MKSRLFLRLITVLSLAFACGCRTTPPPASPLFTIVQMCDPQLGMGGYSEDMQRFAQAVKQVNELHPDFVVVCGDLVNRSEKSSYDDFNALKSKLTVPCYCAAGNHDVGNTPTPRLLKQYRESIGRDYYSFEHKGFLFVVADTQLWKSHVPGESEKHDAWFKKTLEDGAARKLPIVVVSHFPIYVKEPNEPDNYYNLPLEKRNELLALFKRCGVVAHLAGHTHTTNIHDYEGIQMVTSQNTCKNFDKQPFGFRLWHLGGPGPYANEFIALVNFRTLTRSR